MGAVRPLPGAWEAAALQLDGSPSSSPRCCAALLTRCPACPACCPPGLVQTWRMVPAQHWPAVQADEREEWMCEYAAGLWDVATEAPHLPACSPVVVVGGGGG